jgi:hypothetical protein
LPGVTPILIHIPAGCFRAVKFSRSQAKPDESENLTDGRFHLAYAASNGAQAFGFAVLAFAGKH